MTFPPYPRPPVGSLGSPSVGLGALTVLTRPENKWLKDRFINDRTFPAYPRSSDGTIGAMSIFEFADKARALAAEINSYVAKHPNSTAQNDPKLADYAKRYKALTAQAPHDAFGDALRSAVMDTVGAIQKIPVLGPVITAAAAPLSIAVSVSHGERIDHALLDAAKSQLGAIKAIGPYAAAIVSFIPGIGTGIAAALAAGIALAEGKPIDQALEEAVKAAIPGGALAVTGYELAKKVASGKNVAKSVLEAARSQLPPAAQKAFDVGLAVVSGKQLQNAITSAIVSLAPDEVKQILDTGSKAVQSVPGLAALAKSLPTDVARQGLRLASGILARAGVNESQIRAMRSKLTGDLLKGFDTALHAQAAHFPWVDSVVAQAPTPIVEEPQSQDQLDLLEISKLSPDQQQQLVAYKKQQDDLQKLAQLTPAQQKQLVDYANAKNITPKPHELPVKPAATPKPHEPTKVTRAAAPAATSKATPGRPSYGPYPHSSPGLSGPPPSCKALGAPINVMAPGMRHAGLSAVNGSGGRPRMVHSPDGVDYLFMIENGVLTARECLH